MATSENDSGFVIFYMGINIGGFGFSSFTLWFWFRGKPTVGIMALD